MKLFVFCLLSVCLCSWATPLSMEKRKLEIRKLKELLGQLKDFTNSLQQSQLTTKLPTPPAHIEDYCSLSALECFRANLRVHFTNDEDHLLNRLIRSLGSSLTKDGLTFHGRTNATTTCKDCASHPNESADEFFRRLENLIQKGIAW